MDGVDAGDYYSDDFDEDDDDPTECSSDNDDVHMESHVVGPSSIYKVYWVPISIVLVFHVAMQLRLCALGASVAWWNSSLFW